MMEKERKEELVSAGVKLAKLIRVNLVNLRIYPETSKIVETSLRELYNFLHLCLEKFGELTLAEAEGKLVFQSQSLDPGKDFPRMISDEIVDLYNVHELRSITFSPGLSFDELKTFIKSFAEKRETGKGTLVRILLENQVKHF